MKPKSISLFSILVWSFLLFIGSSLIGLGMDQHMGKLLKNPLDWKSLAPLLLSLFILIVMITYIYRDIIKRLTSTSSGDVSGALPKDSSQLQFYAKKWTACLALPPLLAEVIIKYISTSFSPTESLGAVLSLIPLMVAFAMAIYVHNDIFRFTTSIVNSEPLKEKHSAMEAGEA